MFGQEKQSYVLQINDKLSGLPDALKDDVKFELLRDLFDKIKTINVIRYHFRENPIQSLCAYISVPASYVFTFSDEVCSFKQLPDTDSNESLKQYVATHLQFKLLMPGEKVYAAGDDDTGIYVVQSGKIRALLPEYDLNVQDTSERPPIDVYAVANSFGAIESTVITLRLFTTVSVGFVELGHLNLHHWEHLLSHFQVFKQRVTALVKKEVRQFCGLIELDTEERRW
jgi:hypothetical protein